MLVFSWKVLLSVDPVCAPYPREIRMNRENTETTDLSLFQPFTLSPIIMEVEKDPDLKETNLGGTRFPLPLLREEDNFKKTMHQNTTAIPSVCP